MGDTYILRKGVSSISDLVGGAAAIGMGVGNVYYVIKSTETYYDQLNSRLAHVYEDGSQAVHNTIQSGLDATVANRNDYVILWPSQDDYDITSKLTFTKKAVHLICPAGLGNRVGATNAARVHMNTASTAVMNISQSAVEIAGIYFKGYSKQTIVELSTNSYALNLHNNNFIFSPASTDSLAVIDNVVSGDSLYDGGSWGTIEANWFVNSAGGATIPKLVNIHGNAKDCRFKYNEFTISDTTTVTIGIYNDGIAGTADFNTFRAGTGCAWTHCISLHASGSAIGNRATVGDSEIVTGGASGLSFSDNFNGIAGGGAVDDEQ